MRSVRDTLIIVPAFNEVDTIAAVLAELKLYADVFDVVVVDDGSTDGTGAHARAAGAAVIPLGANMGNGVAVQTGLIWAQRRGYRFAAQFDADGQHMANELARLAAAARESGADVTVGSRFLDQASFRPGFMRLTGIRLFSRLLKLLAGETIRDITSGLRVFNRRAIDLLVTAYPDHFPDADVLLYLALNGCRIVEVPVAMRARQGGRTKTGIRGSVYYPFRVSLGMLIALLRGRA